jgi:hypothetical protein
VAVEQRGHLFDLGTNLEDPCLEAAGDRLGEAPREPALQIEKLVVILECLVN